MRSGVKVSRTRVLGGWVPGPAASCPHRLIGLAGSWSGRNIAPRLLVFLFGIGCSWPLPAEAPAAAGGAERWYKGQSHAHTLWDNGDALPELAADWYRSRGYDFVVLSDHNDQNALSEADRWLDLGTEEGGKGLSPAVLRDLGRLFGESWPVVRDAGGGRRQLKLKTFSELEEAFRKDPRFLLLPGEEIGDAFGGKLIHHNALNIRHVLPPPSGACVRELLERAVSATRNESRETGRRTLVHLNHLNLGWAVGAQELIAVAEERFFEVYNGHPLAANGGDRAHPSTEAVWDRVLTARLRSKNGPLLYGVATDDAHHYSGKGDARPGRGWVMVRARELSAEALIQAMDAGDFYSSTGVRLSNIVRGECGISISVAPEPGQAYTIRFIGTRAGTAEVGSVLQETRGTEGTYNFDGDELYVRAVVVSDRAVRDGARTGECETAWIQPVAVGWTLER
jgi:hypothetical protein